MCHHWDIHYHLVVDELVTLAHVEHVVEPQDVTPPLVFGDCHLLKLRLSVNERRTLDANTDFGVCIFLLLYNPELHFGSFVGQVV